MTSVRIGDVVEVVNTGKNYSKYKEWATAYNLTHWKNGNRAANGERGVVVAVGDHSLHLNIKLCAINIHNVKNGNVRTVIIGQSGVKVLQNTAPMISHVACMRLQDVKSRLDNLEYDIKTAGQTLEEATRKYQEFVAELKEFGITVT